MQHNLDLTGGAVMAESVAARLAEPLGRSEAHALVAAVAARAATTGGSLRDELLADPAVTGQLDAAAIDAALNPRSRLGVAAEAVDAAVREHGRRERP
jgi:3-carboxy-cis,cis-muconate cycloisomerase